MRYNRFIFALLCVLTLLVMSGLGPVAGSGVGEHGWCVYRNGFGQLTLVHIPPRSGSDSFEPGTMYSMRALKTKPEAVAAHGSRVALVFPTTMVNEQPIRRVLAGRAVRAAGSNRWLLEPASHLNALASLPGNGTLHGFVTASDTLHALIEIEGNWALHRLEKDGWESIELPATTSAERVLLAWGSAVLVVHRDEHESSAFVLSEGDAWEQVAFDGLDRIWNSSFVLGYNNELVVGVGVGVGGEDGTLEVHVLRSSADLLVATIEDPPEEMGVLILDGSSTLMLVSRIPANKGTQSSIRLIELDLSSGRMVYDDQPIKQSLLNADAARFFMMMLFAMGSLVVMILIRPTHGGVFLVPDRCAIAEPSRRFGAMLIDLGILSVIIAPAFSVGILELLTGNVIARTDEGWLSLPALLALGMVSSTVWETALGATPGKLAVGIRVVRAQQGTAMPLGIGRALVRNLIKWFLPPVVMLSIIEPGYRHRADIASKGVVTVRVKEVEENESDDTPDDESV